MEDWKRGWSIFKKSFTVDTSEEPIYMMTRYRMGTLAATGAAAYNLFLIRQRNIKNARYLTKSTNPMIIKFMCGVVGAIYYMGLYCLWQIPPFFSEVAVRTYVSTEDLVTNILLLNYAE
jgi:hypothetical protein